MDSTYSHSAWASALGGIRLPLLSDFHPKGAVAKSFGLYLEAAGTTDRATVILDAGGTVRYVASVTPAGERDIEALVAKCEAIDAAWEGTLPATEQPPGLPDGVKLYIRDNCMFSRLALYARDNLHLHGALPVVNVSTDDNARAELESLGGKAQAPALRVGDTVMYESKDIGEFLAKHCATR